MAKSSSAERKEKLEKLVTLMESKIDSYILDIEKLTDFHRFRGQMQKKYSIRNCALIDSQFDGAIKVAGFNQWKEEGYTVQKGQKASYILAPSQWKMVTNKKGNDIVPLFKATNEQKDMIDRGELKIESRMSYRTVPVFDIHQTDAPIEDYPDFIQQFYLIGQTEKFTELFSAIENFREDQNIIRYTERPINVKQSAANGFYIPSEHALWVDPSLPKDHFIKTNLHEIAHAVMHENTNLPSALREYQAELTAGLVTSYFGLESTEPATAYIHNHVNGMEIKDKELLLNEILDVSDKMIESMERHLEKEFGLNKDSDKVVNDVIALEEAKGINNEIPNSLINQLINEKPLGVPEQTVKLIKDPGKRTLNAKLDEMLGKQSKNQKQIANDTRSL